MQVLIKNLIEGRRLGPKVIFEVCIVATDTQTGKKLAYVLEFLFTIVVEIFGG